MKTHLPFMINTVQCITLRSLGVAALTTITVKAETAGIITGILVLEMNDKLIKLRIR